MPRLTPRLTSRLPADRWFPAGVPGIESRFVPLRSGLTVRVIESGPAEGRPVMLIHGWACSVFSFRENMPALARAGFHVYAVDMKGHGRSDKPQSPKDYTLESLTEHLLDVLDALALDRAALVGQSLGGAVATRVALAAPDRVSALALISPVGFGRVRLATLAGRLLPPVSARLLPHLALRPFFQSALVMAYGGRPSESTVDEYWAPSQDPSFLRALHSLLREVDWHPVRPERLRGVQVPVLILFGTTDRFISASGLEEYARHIPRAHIVLIEGGGHAVHEQLPAQTNAALLEFFGAGAGGGVNTGRTGAVNDD